MFVKTHDSVVPRGGRWWALRVGLATSLLAVVGLGIFIRVSGGTAQAELNQRSSAPVNQVGTINNTAESDCTGACTPVAVMDSGLSDSYTPTRPAPTPAPEPTPTAPPALVEFTLRTEFQSGKMLYIGVGGDIDGVVNPTFEVAPGTVVRAILVNGDGMTHDLYFPDFEARTDKIGRVGETTEVTFTVSPGGSGTYVYYCTLPGHRAAGQEGQFVVR